MKRLFLLSVILINSVVIFAQLKVDSNGHVGLGSSASSFASQLSINMTGHSDYAVSSAGADNGIYSEAQGNYAGSFRTSNDAGYRFGLFADAQSAEPSGFLSYSYGSKGAAGYGVYANASRALGTMSVGADPVSARNTVLYQNTPNPFHEQTTIRFRLADDTRDACICIFDMTGKMLRKLPVTTGMESVTVNGWELGEDLFLYSLIVNSQEIDTKRMIITK